MQEIPGIAFSSSITTRRRAAKAATISVTGACGPVRAAMPAHWVGALTQEWQLMARRVAPSISRRGQTA